MSRLWPLPCYDKQDRLTHYELGTVSASCGSQADVSYALNGNIQEKGDYVSYTYEGGSASHRLTSMTHGSHVYDYNYDANGNIESRRGSTITWTSYNKPSEINSPGGGARTKFHYGPDRARYKQVLYEGGSWSQQTLYVGAYYERESTSSGSTSHRLYVRLGGASIAVEKFDGEDKGSRETQYLHRDHLGSLAAITESDLTILDDPSSGQEIGRFSYDPWGKRRDPNTWADLGHDIFEGRDVHPRGFTDHEHLPAVGLIHMNGRVYDAQIGRFMSADSYVQFPEWSQSYNRYSYALNGPLRYGDPSGHSVIAIGVFNALWSGAVATTMEGVAAYMAAAVGGYMTGFVTTGEVSGGVQSGLSTAAFHGVGEAFGEVEFGSPKHLGKTLSHGVLGGALSQAGGGRFKDGFVGAAAGQLAAPAIDNIGQGSLDANARLLRVMTAAIVGGSAAEASGGKFANGAVTAAFARAYNEEMQLKEREEPSGHQVVINAHLNDAVDSMNDSFDTFVTSAETFSE